MGKDTAIDTAASDFLQRQKVPCVNEDGTMCMHFGGVVDTTSPITAGVQCGHRAGEWIELGAVRRCNGSGPETLSDETVEALLRQLEEKAV